MTQLRKDEGYFDNQTKKIQTTLNEKEKYTSELLPKIAADIHKYPKDRSFEIFNKYQDEFDKHPDIHVYGYYNDSLIFWTSGSVLVPYLTFDEDFVHPVAKMGRFSEFSGLPNVHVEKPPEVMTGSDFMNLKLSLFHCDININYSSTVSLEAILLDKPVINYIEPGMPIYDYDHYRPLVEAGAVRLVSQNPDDLAQTINGYLDNPGLDKENREKISEVYFPFKDGLSSKRSVDFLKNIIGGI